MVVWKPPDLSPASLPRTSLPVMVRSEIWPCCASCRKSEKAISVSLPPPVLFWKTCHRTTRHAKMKTQKMIVLTVEFTKKTSFLSSADRKEDGGRLVYDSPSGEPPLHICFAALDVDGCREVSTYQCFLEATNTQPNDARHLSSILLPRRSPSGDKRDRRKTTGSKRA